MNAKKDPANDLSYSLQEVDNFYFMCSYENTCLESVNGEWLKRVINKYACRATEL